MFTEIATELTSGSTAYLIYQHSLLREEITAVSVPLWQTLNSVMLLSQCRR